jgi:carbonic anhydrase
MFSVRTVRTLSINAFTFFLYQVYCTLQIKTMHFRKFITLYLYFLLMTDLNLTLLTSNEKYAANFKQGGLAAPPAKKIAILTCMDARISVKDILGLNLGDAHIIRNAGGIATDDAIRSLIISHELLGTEEFIVINHTDCGMLKYKDQDLQKKISEKFNIDTSSLKFYTFSNLEENIREQINKIKSSPFFPNVPVHGYVYDVKTGKLENVV